MTEWPDKTVNYFIPAKQANKNTFTLQLKLLDYFNVPHTLFVHLDEW